MKTWEKISDLVVQLTDLTRATLNKSTKGQEVEPFDSLDEMFESENNARALIPLKLI